ncbi:MAG: sporulation transcription factor Spo0A [Clostridia bacterium]|nr:sporulation transcription factor Spo0A [Clostridia bacterium]
MKDIHSLILADESEEELTKLQEIFTKDKFNIVGIAKDGETLLSLVKEHTPDVLIMDLVLPKIDGYSVLEYIKQEKLKTNVFIHSSLSVNGFASKALDLGAKYYAIKPFNLKMLKDRVIGCLEESSTSYSKTGNQVTSQMEEKITNIFITVGIPAHIKGYQFLREAIKLAITTPDIINSITKRLYPTIADAFSTSASKVERAIRHAIEVAWNRGKIENINNLFGIKVYSNNEKPTNGEFIALVADKMLIEGA